MVVLRSSGSRGHQSRNRLVAKEFLSCAAALSIPLSELNVHLLLSLCYRQMIDFQAG